MKPKTVAAIRTTLKEAAASLPDKMEPLYSEPRWEYRRDSNGSVAGSFKLAKELYGLRSKIVHGSSVVTSQTFGPEKLTLVQLAQKGREALRRVILYFLDSPAPSAFTKKGYWEGRQLALPHK